MFFVFISSSVGGLRAWVGKVVAEYLPRICKQAAGIPGPHALRERRKTASNVLICSAAPGQKERKEKHIESAFMERQPETNRRALEGALKSEINGK